ncbi:hypothetical protein [Psychrobacter sp. BF1]|uniref:hypothetical protein n=1 Tax=Psychrobacter sp. BF1 TaxID=2821147 RepID=UPI001C4E2026|nr:hypothetical protein [Psychrobacter sp. BF1]
MQSQSMDFSDKASKLLCEYESDCQNDDEMGDKSHNYLMKFYEILGEYIAAETFIKLEELRYECTSEQEAYELDEDIKELHVHLAVGEYSGVSGTLSERLGNINIVIENIVFPNDDNLKYLESEIREILWRMGRIDFINCKFKSNNFRINNNVYFEDCIFQKSLSIKPFSKNKFNDRYRYLDCTFDKEVYVIPSNENEAVLCNLFKECNFLDKLNIRDLVFKKFLFSFSDPLSILENQSVTNPQTNEKINIEKIEERYIFDDLIINNCVFEKDLKLNGFSEDYLQKIRNLGCKLQKSDLIIGNLEIIDTKFESKLEIKSTSIENFKFTNSNVEKIFDTFQSKFIKAKFSKSIFSDFAGFEEVKFGSIDKKDNISFITIFEHVTFLDFSSFREANFKSGLDFSKTNLKDKPNFLGVKIDSLNTKRETFRIVKSSFDNASNQIEANKYFVKEMNAYRRELRENKGDCSERVILFFNRIISNFGTSYIWPILYLILFIIVYTFLLRTYQNEMQYRTYALPLYLDCITEWLNTGARNFLPFARFVGGSKGFEFVSLLFYIIFGVFIWQIIVAVKRHTQR